MNSFVQLRTCQPGGINLFCTVEECPTEAWRYFKRHTAPFGEIFQVMGRISYGTFQENLRQPIAFRSTEQGRLCVDLPFGLPDIRTTEQQVGRNTYAYRFHIVGKFAVLFQCGTKVLGISSEQNGQSGDVLIDTCLQLGNRRFGTVIYGLGLRHIQLGNQSGLVAHLGNLKHCGLRIAIADDHI